MKRFELTGRDGGASSQLPDSAWRQIFRRRLLSWYRRAARDLPWRRTRDPYAIWVSEVMLQQTQVVTVESYFSRFLQQFPDITSLAAADEQRVLRMWEGLGYYRRARQLHQAAKTIVRDFDGEFPRNAAAAQQLPGIGRYTAGAILSIAFDAREPVLEANTIRVLSRLLAYRKDPTKAEGQRVLWTFAELLLPRRNVGTMNQALMELGSEVCRPRDPQCDLCPVGPLCGARRQGLQAELPVRRKSTRYENVHEVAVVIRRNGRALLRRCTEDERWAGLWDFPRFPVDFANKHRQREQIIRHVKQRTGLTVQPGELVTTLKHGVTRFRITLDCYEASVVSGRIRRSSGQLQWVRPQDFGAYPLSVTGRKLSKLLLERTATR